MSRKATRYSAVLAASLFAAALAGCGSENKEGSIGTGPGGVATVGDTACVQCHSAVTEALTGESIITQYQKSSPHNAPGLGCESCHGGGAQHNGVGPLPFAHPDANRCADCHDGTTVYNGVVPRATNAHTAFATSNHATGTPSHTSGTCVRCHTHEGALLSNKSGITGGNTVFTANPMPVVTVAYTGIKCETCHEHGGGLRSIIAKNASNQDVAWNPSKASGAKNNQFNLCTSCHSLYNFDGSNLLANGVVSVNGKVTESVISKHAANGDWNRIIISTHNDDTTTGYGLASNVVEGYVIRTKGTNPCFDCHGHEAKTNTRAVATDPSKSTIHTDWAKSAHAGRLLTKKFEAYSSSKTLASVLSAGVDANDPWVHYNWDDTSTRAACQRCHTATGASNFMTSPTNYDPQNNDFSHLSGWKKAGGSPQQELLYCWGCHTNAGTGTLRSPGALSITSEDDPSTKASYPDAKGSSICLSCHTGYNFGTVIKNSTQDGTNTALTKSHYMTAGGTLYRQTGYEFTGRNYTNPSYFAHDKIGSAAAPGTGSNGPCAGCHMTTPNSHSFKNIRKDSGGVITALTSTACVTCHKGEHGPAFKANDATAAAYVEEESQGYQAARDALKAVIYALAASKGIAGTTVYTPNYPYSSQKDWTVFYGQGKWKDAQGAVYNLYLLDHEKGGYAHNRYYVKRLIWDSIDFMYNGALDNDVVAAIDTVATAGGITAQQAATAKAYLGTTRP